MVQFGSKIFCRTFKNYFGQLAWIEKKKKKSHYNSRVSLHEAPIKNDDQPIACIYTTFLERQHVLIPKTTAEL